MLVWIECIAVLATAIVATIAATPLAKALATRTGAIDYPGNRRVNEKPTPRMGGLAMFIGLAAASFVAVAGHYMFGWMNPFHGPSANDVNFVLVGAGVVFMFGVGMLDDYINLRARYKFLGQIIACCLVASSGLLFHNIQNPFIPGSFIQFGILSYPITVIYLVCFANVINLIDGLDGLASGISAISAGTIFAFAMLASRFDAAILCAMVIGICIGFLRYNYHPASIFMGDSGSLLLGLGLGIVSLFAVARSTLIISLLVPLLAAGVPIMDTAAAIIRRKRAHQPIDSPDKGHIHHRLLSAGFTQQSTVLIMWAWTAMLALCGIVLAESRGMLRVVVIVIAATVTGIAIYKLRLLDPVLQHYYSPRKSKIKRKLSASGRASSKPSSGSARTSAKGGSSRAASTAKPAASSSRNRSSGASSSKSRTKGTASKGGSAARHTASSKRATSSKSRATSRRSSRK